MKIKKAVIPVAGKGTRFLPATKEIPKEMIPVIDKPMIHYVVEEAVLSGIEQVIFITSSGKESIENYFDRNLQLETFLQRNSKNDLNEKIIQIGQMINVVCIRQKEQLGLGHAILCAKEVIGQENFAVLLGDDITRSEVPVIKQLMDISAELADSPVIGVMQVAPEETPRYGIIDGENCGDNKRVLKLKNMVEKPAPERAPSNLATPGRYVFTPEIFDFLEKIPRGVGGEYQLTDAINAMARDGEVYSYLFEGERFDTGSIQGYLDATVDFALTDERTRGDMIKIIKSKIKKFRI